MSNKYSFINDALGIVAQGVLFEIHTSDTQRHLEDGLSEYCATLKENGICVDFIVICDATNNPEDRVANNELWSDVAIQFEEGGTFVYFPIRLGLVPVE